MTDINNTRIAEIRAQSESLRAAFMTCVAGDGKPYVKIQFQSLTNAQDCHSVISGIPFLLAEIDRLTAERDKLLRQKADRVVRRALGGAS